MTGSGAAEIAVIRTGGGDFPRAPRRYQGIPGVEVMPSGRIFVCFYCGDEPGEGPGNYVIVTASGDCGRSWREIAAFLPGGPELRLFDPVLWLAPDGVLRLFWSQSRSRKLWDVFDGRSGVWLAECRDPDAAVPKWSAPRRIGDGTMMNKPTVLHDGRWALPTALWSILPETMLPELRDRYRSNLLLTGDGGRTWQFMTGPDVPNRHFDEHVIVERADRALWVLVRTSYGIGQSFSFDGGESWTPGGDSGLNGPNSRFALRRLRSGRLCLVNHRTAPHAPSEKPPRDNLTVRLSDDDGASWSGGLLLAPGPDVSYPDFTEGGDGFIYAVYDCDRYGKGQIFLARFTENDIRAQGFVTPGSTGGILVASFASRPASEPEGKNAK